MDVFLSWSGKRSGAVATALKDWLEGVIQSVKPWVSSDSIDPGVRWSDELSVALGKSNVGIICLTKDNLEAPWVFYEAGAIAKAVGKARTIPYLLDFQPRELTGPLAQFQAVTATKSGTLKMLKSVNTALEGNALPANVLENSFDVWWPRLETKIHSIKELPLEQASPPRRETDDVLNEILELVRSFAANTESVHFAPANSNVNIPLESANVLVGSVVRRYRASAAIGLDDLASRTSIPPRTILRIEAGEVLPLKTELLRLAAVLRIPPHELPFFPFVRSWGYSDPLEDKQPTAPPDKPPNENT